MPDVTAPIEVVEPDGSRRELTIADITGPAGSDADATAAIEAHRVDATDVHGIPDTALLVTDADLSAALASKQDAATASTDAELAAEATARQAADDAIDAALNAKADLVGGVIPTAQLPALATGQTVPVASQAAMLALTAADVQPGDVAIRTDQAGRRFLLADPDPSLLTSWIPLEVPDAVSSVNGQQGAVVLGAGDVGAPTAADLAAEATARANADTAEANARAAADAALQAGIDAKQDAATAATDADLAAEADDRAAGDTANAAAAAAAQATADAALPKAGGTMGGDLVLVGDPDAPLEAAPKQYVDSAVAALVNGAPGALDTLKELADQLATDEGAEEALAAVVAGKLGAAENLADLVDVVTARENLGLEDAATHPASDFATPAALDAALATKADLTDGVVPSGQLPVEAPWLRPSVLAADLRPATDLLMSQFDTDPLSVDQTAAFEAARDAAVAILAAGASMVRIILDSRQKYTIAGPVKDGGHGQWAQVPLPYSQTVAGTIQLVGEPRGHDYSYLSMGQSGTVIESTLAAAPAFQAARGIASVFGGPASFAGARAYTAGWSYIKFATKDITIRSASPVVCGIDAGWLTGFQAEGLLQFDTDQLSDITDTAGNLNFATITVCNAPQAVPIIFPFALDWYGMAADSIVVSGWACGPLIGEGGHIRKLVVFAVPGAMLNVSSSKQITRIEYLYDWNNAYGIATLDGAFGGVVPVSPSAAGNAPGSGYAAPGDYAPLMIGSWSSQAQAAGGPNPAALNRVYDLMDANNRIWVDAKIAQTKPGGGAKNNALQLVGDGGALNGFLLRSRIRSVFQAVGLVAFAVPASNAAIRNPTSRDCLVTIRAGAGGTVTSVKVNGVEFLTGPGQALVPANAIISVTYTVTAPTWLWQTT